MKKLILLIVFAAIICFITGCGPVQPFEIEDVTTQTHISVVR